MLLILKLVRSIFARSAIQSALNGELILMRLANGQVSAGPLQDFSHHQIQEQFRQLARQPKIGYGAGRRTAPRQEAVDQLITAYRRFGHLNANINPLGYEAPIDSRLELKHYQLGSADLDQSVFNSRCVAESQSDFTGNL